MYVPALELAHALVVRGVSFVCGPFGREDIWYRGDSVASIEYTCRKYIRSTFARTSRNI